MSQSGPGQREVAYRLFAAEFDDSELSYSESDQERAPNFVVTPTGARVNRLFAVGVLTEVEDVNPEMVRGRVVGPTGAFVTYAGQYQPDALAFLERADPPAFLALSGKARTYEPEDGDQIYTSVRPESVSEVDAETRDRWIVTTAERTVERIGIVASAIESGLSGDELQAVLSEAGVDERLAEGVALAIEHYETTPDYLNALRELALDAVRVVAGERDEADRLELAPSEGGGDASTLSTLDLSADVGTSATTDEGGGAVEITEGDSISDHGAGDEATTTVTASGDEPEETATSEPGVETDETESIVESEQAIEPSDTDAESTTGVEEASGREPEREAAGSKTGESVTEPAPGTEAEPIDSEGSPTATEEEVESVEEELDDFDPGEFELDEEERREVEEEFGTDFSTAGEVESGETGGRNDSESATESEDTIQETDADTEIDTAEIEPERDSESDVSEPEPDPSGPEPEPEISDEPSDDEEIDLTDAVMETMERLDDGDGADRDAVVSTVTDEHRVAPDGVEEAIQDALMSGRCYEPTDGTLKSI